MATPVIIPKLGNTVESCIIGPLKKKKGVPFIGMEMRVEDIKEIVFPHPTISETIKETICQIK